MSEFPVLPQCGVHAATYRGTATARGVAERIGMTIDDQGGGFHGPKTSDEFHLDQPPGFLLTRLIVTCHNKTNTCLDMTESTPFRKIFGGAQWLTSRDNPKRSSASALRLVSRLKRWRRARLYSRSRCARFFTATSPASPQLMQSFRNVAELEALRRGRYPQDRPVLVLREGDMDADEAKAVWESLISLRRENPPMFESLKNLVLQCRHHGPGPEEKPIHGLPSGELTEAARRSKSRATKIAGIKKEGT